MGVLLGKETAQWVVEQKNKSDSGGSGGQRRFTLDQPAKPFTQTFRNDSGETCPAFGCLKVTDAEEDSTTGRYVLVIDKPDGTGGPFFFNGPREVLDGEYGQAHTGLVKARYTAGTPGVGEVWGPESDWAIVSTGDPAITVMGDIDTNVILGRINNDADSGQLIRKGKTDAAITADSSGTVSIWSGGADTGDNVTAYLDWAHGDEDISLGKEVFIQWFADEQKWIITGAECE